MFPLPKAYSFRAALFWRHFANYFILILVPVIVASMLVHVLVIRLIEDDARKLNDAVMSKFTEQTDIRFGTLRTNMINMLSASDIRGLLRELDNPSPDRMRRAELIRALREQLMKLQSDDIVSRAYLYFVHYDLVVDADLYADKAYYFNVRYPQDEEQKAALPSRFSGKKMMSFAQPQPQSSEIPALMSYPFNSGAPEAYLVVGVRQDKLRELIRIRQDWVAGTAIVGSGGEIVSQSGLTMNDLNRLPRQIDADAKDSRFMIDGEKALSAIPSLFSDSWFYLSVIDLHTLMKPAEMTRTVIWVFLAFFLVVGSIVSFVLSRRIYEPIMEIKEGLQSHREAGGELRGGGDDLHVIKRFSQLILTENRQLSRKVHDMTPIVHEHFIAKLLHGRFRDEPTIEACAKEIDFAYSKTAPRTVLCIAFHYNAAYEGLSEASRSFLMAELKERIRRLIPPAVWLCQMKPDAIACVLHHDPHDPHAPLSPEEDANVLRLALQQYGSYFKATIGIGTTVQAVRDLHLSYQAAVSALQLRGLNADVEICNCGSLERSAPCDSFLSVQEVTHILNQFRAREFGKLLQSAFDLVEEGIRSNATVARMRLLGSDLLSTWIRAAETERKDLSGPFYADLYRKLNGCVTGDEMKACFQDIHGHLFPVAESGERARKFNDILAYIEAHYDEELSIEYFSGTLNMSVGHFSRVFKEEIGEKYVEYIAKVRLRKAKEMLLETDWKIDDIAGRVGYWGRNSFIRMFRKYEGITPAQYRAIHQ